MSRSNGKEEESEDVPLNLEPLQKTLEAAIQVLKLGTRWVKAEFTDFSEYVEQWFRRHRPTYRDRTEQAQADEPGKASQKRAPKFQPWRPQVEYMLSTYDRAFEAQLNNYRELYGIGPELLSQISKFQPLADAIRFLDDTIEAFEMVYEYDLWKPDVIKRLENACEILDEVLKEMETSRPQPSNLPNWDLDTKTLTYDRTICLEYKRTAYNQFQVLNKFQEDGWPPDILISFDSDEALMATIYHMNKKLKPASPIQFAVRRLKPAWEPRRPCPKSQ
jgi:hypothetical protein